MNNVNADTLTMLFVAICMGISILAIAMSLSYCFDSKVKSKAKPLDTSKTEEKEEETVEQEEEEKPKEEKPKYDFIYKVSEYGVTLGILKITENPTEHRIEVKGITTVHNARSLEEELRFKSKRDLRAFHDTQYLLEKYFSSYKFKVIDSDVYKLHSLDNKECICLYTLVIPVDLVNLRTFYIKDGREIEFTAYIPVFTDDELIPFPHKLSDRMDREKFKSIANRNRYTAPIILPSPLDSDIESPLRFTGEPKNIHNIYTDAGEVTVKDPDKVIKAAEDYVIDWATKDAAQRRGKVSNMTYNIYPIIKDNCWYVVPSYILVY